MALYRRNQAAFGGSIHKLPAGAQLALPDDAEMRQQPRHEARAAIRSRDETVAPRAARPDRLVISGDAAATTDGRGRLGSGSSATRTVALEAARAEADSRIRDLQKNVDDLNRMLELRDRQLSKLQDTARRMSDERAAAPVAPAAAMPVAAVGSAPPGPGRAAADPARVPEPAVAAPTPPTALRPVPVPEAAPASGDWFSDWRIQAGAGVLAAVLVLTGVAITLRVSRPGAPRGLTGGMRDWRDPAGGRSAARRS
jgi:pilus assembly protein FimV